MPLIDFELAGQACRTGRGLRPCWPAQGVHLARDHQHHHGAGAEGQGPEPAEPAWPPAATPGCHVGPASAKASWRPGHRRRPGRPAAWIAVRLAEPGRYPPEASRSTERYGVLPQADIADPTAVPGPGGQGRLGLAVTAYRTVDYPGPAGACRADGRAWGSPPVSGRTAWRVITAADNRGRAPDGGIDAVVLTSPSATRRVGRTLDPWPAGLPADRHRPTARHGRPLGPALPSRPRLPSRTPSGHRRPRSHRPCSASPPKRKERHELPHHRPRRLRATPAIRRLTAGTPDPPAS